MAGDRVDRVDSCELMLHDTPWAYAREHEAAIEAHWISRLRYNPGFFNGPIHIASEARVADRRLSATMMRTDFKTFLYWREQGYPEAGACDAFGSAIIRTGDGAVLLGKQRAGHINEGLAYLPGGFIDARDVREGGLVDIAASIAREVGEETHLGRSDLTPKPGFYVVRCGALLSIAQELVSPAPADVLRAKILASLAADPDPELADIVTIRGLEDVGRHAIPPYTQMALAAVLQAP